MAVDKDVSLELQHAANLVIEAGLHAARGERSREYFRRLAELLNLYISSDNLVDGNPQHPLPAIVAKQLANLCHYLGDGIIPGPIKHCFFVNWRVETLGHATAIFRQVNKTEPMKHHDALEFPDGRIVLLTRLSEGQEATVLQLPAQPTTVAEAVAQKRIAYVG